MIIQAQLTGDDFSGVTISFAGIEASAKRNACNKFARLLLDHGYDREDTLEFWRGDQRCQYGTLGWFADRVVSEADQGALSVRKFVPFSGLKRGIHPMHP